MPSSPYYRVDGDQIIERRDLEAIPEHKRHLWRPEVIEGEGPIAITVVEADRVRVVRSYPAVVADDVRAEAQRRIIALTGATSLDGCLIKQLNALMRGTELVNKRASGGTLTAEEEAEAAALQAMADAVKAIRAASNAMESNPPSDYASDERWP